MNRSSGWARPTRNQEVKKAAAVSLQLKEKMEVEGEKKKLRDRKNRFAAKLDES